MKHVRIPGWQKYVHYKDRAVKWIKLPQSLVDDTRLLGLAERERWWYVGFLLLAAETGNQIPTDPLWLKTRLRFSQLPDIEKLLEVGLLEPGEGETEEYQQSEGTKAMVAARQREAEVKWRIGMVWNAHLKAREQYFTRQNGTPPSRGPTLTGEIRSCIRQALLEYDAGALEPEARDRWKMQSPVRAAGIGIFYDLWCTGRAEGNKIAEGGREYLEPWRPWKKLQGKADPIARFSDNYFKVRDANRDPAVERTNGPGLPAVRQTGTDSPGGHQRSL